MQLVSYQVPLVVACFIAQNGDAKVIGTLQFEGVGEVFVCMQFINVAMDGNGFRLTADAKGYLLTKDPGSTSFWQVRTLLIISL